jgi:hypothetical protein
VYERRLVRGDAALIDTQRKQLLADALNESVVVTTNGRRRRITKREAVIAQLVNKSAGADLRATKMLIDMLKDIEKKAGMAPPPPSEAPRFTPADEEVVAGLVARIRRQVVSEIATTNGQDTAAS